MMVFRAVVDSFKKVLQEAIDGDSFESKFMDQFCLIGYPKRQTSAKESKGRYRQCKVFYQTGDFSEQKDEPKHNSTLSIELIVSSPAKGSTEALIDPDSTDEERQLAMAEESFTSMEICDALMDEFFEIIYTIVMDAQNDQLGVDRYYPEYNFRVNNVMVQRFEKNEPQEKKSHAILTANAYVNFECVELITGEKLTLLDEIVYNQNIKFGESEIINTEVEVTKTN